jgi:hypothetical protein
MLAAFDDRHRMCFHVRAQSAVLLVEPSLADRIALQVEDVHIG